MNSFSIFAGIDSFGAVRFVGDVPRGAACGCRCAECGSALVAKRGNVKTWHFAHEASQERPECFAGAVNLLRRLAIEQLQQSGIAALPHYRVRVTTSPPLPTLQESVEWDVGPARVVGWQPNPARHAPAASLLLKNSGTTVQLFVEIAAKRSAELDAVAADEGRLLFDVPLPDEAGHLKDLDAAKIHIHRNGVFYWRGLPGRHPKVEETRQRLERLAQQQARLPAEINAVYRMGGRQPPAAQAPRPFLPPATAVPIEVDGSPWAAWRKPRHTFLFYGLKDGSAWVLFPHRDGRYAMAPWPCLVDGWAEKVPAIMATVDRELGVYFVADRLAMMVELGRLSKTTRSYSWSELVAAVWPSS